ncbi:MAG: glycosyltransferase [Microthrixaceae bacterium]
MTSPRLDWVVLTTGDRADDLAAALNSIGPHLLDGERIHLVLNGRDLVAPEPSRLEPSVQAALHVIHAGENLGIPGGRNLGAAASDADVVAFLDDDAVVESADLGTQLRARFGADPRLGGVSFRIVDPESGRTAQRHVPRPGGRGLEREGRVTSFLGGASALSGPMFRSVDGYCAEFFYAHEESDLAWRAIAAGWRFTYAPSLVVTHPLLPTTRHAGAIERSMRNRVWLVRRNLPLPVGLLHLVNWLAIGLVRTRSVAGVRAMIAGFRTGWAGPPPSGGPNGVGASGASALVRWRLCWRLTRLGRPPLL